MRSTCSRSTSPVSSPSTWARASQPRLSWSSRTPTILSVPLLRLFGILIKLRRVLVFLTHSCVSSKCRQTCRRSLIFGTWTILTSRRRLLKRTRLFALWPSITNKLMSWLLACITVLSLSSICVAVTNPVLLSPPTPLSSKNPITTQSTVALGSHPKRQVLNVCPLLLMVASSGGIWERLPSHSKFLCSLTLPKQKMAPLLKSSVVPVSITTRTPHPWNTWLVLNKVILFRLLVGSRLKCRFVSVWMAAVTTVPSTPCKEIPLTWSTS